MNKIKPWAVTGLLTVFGMEWTPWDVGPYPFWGVIGLDGLRLVTVTFVAFIFTQIIFFALKKEDQ